MPEQTLTGQQVEYWLAALEAEGRSPETIKTYRTHLRIFLRLLGERELNPFTFRSVFAEYRQGRAPWSVRTVYESVRACIRFLAREGALNDGVLSAMRPPKVPDTQGRMPTPGQVRALLQALTHDKSPTGLRDYAICSVMADCGLRAGEICALTLDSLQPEGFLRLVMPKVGRVRVAPLGRKALAAVYRYLAAGRPRLKPRGDWLFVTADGNPLSRNTIRLMLERRSRLVGFRVSAHALRRFWATQALKATRDLETVRRIGGWCTFDAMRPYLNIVAGDMETVSVVDRL